MKAVFLDRDGTLIVDPPDLRVDSIEEVELFPETLPALRTLAKLDYGVFLISNQAGIGEGRLTIEEFRIIEDVFIARIVPSGIRIVKTYVCPHLAEDNCQCRKPKPFMIEKAAREFDIDLANSYMIGDRQTDIMTGVNAGTKTILVQTGNEPVTSAEATVTVPTINEAVDYIAAHDS
jgi:histidinol-phosphate phosphatase family protein